MQKLGKNTNKRVAGRHALHDITRENGEKLVQLAIAQNLEINSTKIQHRRIHKGTWKVPRQDICNQTDHVLINKRRASTIIEVRTFLGTNCDSNHYLVRTKIRQRISKVEEGIYRRSRKLDVTKLQNPDIKNKYEKNIARKLNETDSSPDTELEWDNLKTIINDVAYDDVGIKIIIKNAGWFDEDCRKPIKAKNEARNKCIIRNTRANKEEYMKRRNEARKICRDKNREMINNEIKELEIENRNKNRKFKKN
jgi:hypothetical protein